MDISSQLPPDSETVFITSGTREPDPAIVGQQFLAPSSLEVHVRISKADSLKGGPLEGRRVLDLAEVEIRLDLIDGVYHPSAVSFRAEPGGTLPVDLGREVPVKLLIRMALETFRPYEIGPTDFSTTNYVEARWAFEMGTATPDQLAQVAAGAYITSRLSQSDPTKAVAELLGVSANAAAKRIQRARAIGLIPPTTKGRVSAPKNKES